MLRNSERILFKKDVIVMRAENLVSARLDKTERSSMIIARYILDD